MTQGRMVVVAGLVTSFVASLGAALVGTSLEASASTRQQPGAPVVREAHSEPITTVRYYPTGSSMASSAGDGRILLRSSSGEPNSAIDAHSTSATALAISSNGKLLASGSEDGELQVRDALTGRQVRRGLPKFDGAVHALAFRPGDRLLAVGTSDRVHLLSLSDWNVTRQIVCQFDVRSIAFSPDGTLLAIGREDRRIQVVNVDSGSTLTVLRGHRQSVPALAFHPTEPRLVSGSTDRTLRMWDLSDRGFGRELRAIDGFHGEITTVGFNGVGDLIAAGTNLGQLRIFDAQTGFELLSFDDIQSAISSLDFHPESNLIACGIGTDVRLIEARAELFRAPTFDVDFDVEDLRVISDEQGNPVRILFRVANRGESSAGSVKISAEVLEPESGAAIVLDESIEITDLAARRTSQILFFELSEEAIGVFDASDTVRIRVHADSLLVEGERRSRTVPVSARALTLEFGDLTFIRDEDESQTLAEFTLAHDGVDRPGPIQVVTTVQSTRGRALGQDEREIRFDAGVLRHTITVALPPRLPSLLRRDPTIEIRVLATRVEWATHEWTHRDTVSVRAPDLELSDFVLVTGDTDAPQALRFQLRQQRVYDLGPLSIVAELVAIDPNAPSIRASADPDTTWTMPENATEPLEVTLPLTEAARRTIATQELARLRINVFRTRWPTRSWETSLEFGTQPLDLAIEDLTFEGGTDSEPLEVIVALANRGSDQPGSVALTFELDGRPAAETRLDRFAPTAATDEPLVVRFQPPRETWPRRGQQTTTLTVRARRPIIPGPEWSGKRTLTTDLPELQVIGVTFFDDDRGVPTGMSLRLRNEGPQDPGPLDIVGRFSRPGRKVPKDRDVTRYRLSSLAPGADSEALPFNIPWEVLMGGVGVEGVRFQLTVDREQWAGKRWQKDMSVLHQPSIDVRDFEVVPGDQGTPENLRFLIASTSNADIEAARVSVEYYSGLRGNLVATSDLGTPISLLSRTTSGPHLVTIPENVRGLFDSIEYVKTRVRVDHAAWSELRTAAIRLIPTHDPRVAIYALEVVDQPASGKAIELILQNEDTIATQPMRVSIDLVDRKSESTLIASTQVTPVPALGPASRSGQLRFDLPDEALAALEDDRKMTVRVNLRGAMVPEQLVVPLNTRRRITTVGQARTAGDGGGFPWPWVLVAVLAGAAGTVTVLRIRARRLEAAADAAGADVEFFALVEMNDEANNDDDANDDPEAGDKRAEQSTDPHNRRP